MHHTSTYYDMKKTSGEDEERKTREGCGKVNEEERRQWQ